MTSWMLCLGDPAPTTYCSARSPTSVFLRIPHCGSHCPSVVRAPHEEFGVVRLVSTRLSLWGRRYEEEVCGPEGPIVPERESGVCGIS